MHLPKRLQARALLRGCAAFMYHAIETADGRPESEDYTVPATLFARHLLALERAQATAFPLSRMLADCPAPSDLPSVLITFDDGFETVLTEAAEPLGDAGLSAIVFITADKIGQPGYLSAEQVRVLLGMGIVVGAHGATHRYLTDLPLEDLRRELEGPRDRLSALVGYPVRWLSAPGGRVDARVVEEARRAGYTTIFGSRPGLIPLDGPMPDVLPRLAITTQTTPDFIEKMAKGEGGEQLLKALARYKALEAPKKVLGNAGYDAVRRAALGLWRRR